jgi:Neocarzinostatin family
VTDVDLTIDDPSGQQPRGHLHQRIALLGLLLVLVVGLGAAVALSGGTEEATEDDDDADVESVLLDLGGPYDGLDSLGLPVVAEPDIGLVDNDTVVVSGSGFTPGAQVGVAQCRFGEGPRGQDNCDIGNVALGGVDELGNVEISIPVRRFISIASGTYDCADGGIVVGCGLGVGNIADYDESGSARIFFDGEIDGEVPPRIEVTPTTALSDGQQLMVSGSGFEPGETALLTQCMIGGNNGVGGCYGQNPVGEVQVDEQGSFAVSVPAQRLVHGFEGEIDCYLGPYPCLVVVGAGRVPNTVRLEYDGSTGAPAGLEYTVTSNDGLVDEQAIRVDFFDLRVEGPLSIFQCVDQGQIGETCIPLAEVGIIDGGAGADVNVAQILINADGDPVDCGGPGRTCYLRATAPKLDPVLIPIHFVPTVVYPTTSAESGAGQAFDLS